MNAARRRLEAAKKRNAERTAAWHLEDKNALNNFVAGFAVLRAPCDCLPCSFLIPRDKIHSTIKDITMNGLWMRRKNGALNFVPPDNIAVVEVEELENT